MASKLDDEDYPTYTTARAAGMNGVLVLRIPIAERATPCKLIVAGGTRSAVQQAIDV